MYYESTMSIRTYWIGGKPAGWVNDVPNRGFCQIAFSNERNIPSVCYTYTHHGGHKEAVQKAEIERKRISDEQGLTKNKYRYVTEPSGYVWVEVQMQDPELIMQCEVEHIPLIEERIWTAHKGIDKKVYYAKSRASKKRGYEHSLFHSLAYPNLNKVDHIDRNGLNNRRNNIREGVGRINANNKGKQKNNTSGVTGVYRCGNGWAAQWVDKDGNRHKKRFSVKDCTDEEAKARAVAYRNMERDKCLKALGIENDNCHMTENSPFKDVSTNENITVSNQPNNLKTTIQDLCFNDDETLTEFGKQVLNALKEEFGANTEFIGNRVRYKKTRMVNRDASSVPLVRRMIEELQNCNVTQKFPSNKNK